MPWGRARSGRSAACVSERYFAAVRGNDPAYREWLTAIEE